MVLATVLMRRGEQTLPTIQGVQVEVARINAGGRTLLDALRTLSATRLQANQLRQACLLSLAALERATGVSGIAPRL